MFWSNESLTAQYCFFPRAMKSKAHHKGSIDFFVAMTLWFLSRCRKLNGFISSMTVKHEDAVGTLILTCIATDRKPLTSLLVFIFADVHWPLRTKRIRSLSVYSGFRYQAIFDDERKAVELSRMIKLYNCRMYSVLSTEGYHKILVMQQSLILQNT